MSEPKSGQEIIISGGQLDQTEGFNNFKGFKQLFPELVAELDVQEDEDLGKFIKLTEDKILALLDSHPERRLSLIQLLSEEIGLLYTQEQTPKTKLERYADKMSDEQKAETRMRIDKYAARIQDQIKNLQRVRDYVSNLPDIDARVDVKGTFLGRVPLVPRTRE